VPHEIDLLKDGKRKPSELPLLFENFAFYEKLVTAIVCIVPKPLPNELIVGTAAAETTNSSESQLAKETVPPIVTTSSSTSNTVNNDTTALESTPVVTENSSNTIITAPAEPSTTVATVVNNDPMQVEPAISKSEPIATIVEEQQASTNSTIQLEKSAPTTTTSVDKMDTNIAEHEIIQPVKPEPQNFMQQVAQPEQHETNSESSVLLKRKEHPEGSIGATSNSADEEAATKDSDSPKRKRVKSQKSDNQIHEFLRKEKIFMRNTRSQSKTSGSGGSALTPLTIPTSASSQHPAVASSSSSSSHPVMPKTPPPTPVSALPTPSSASASVTPAQGDKRKTRKRSSLTGESPVNTPPPPEAEQPTPIKQENALAASTPLINSAASSSSSAQQFDESELKEKKLLVKELMLHSINSYRKANRFSIFLQPEEAMKPVVHRRVDLTSLSKQIQSGKINSVMELWRSLLLMCQNSQFFNQPDTTFYKDATFVRTILREQTVDLFIQEAKILGTEVPPVIKSLYPDLYQKYAKKLQTL